MQQIRGLLNKLSAFAREMIETGRELREQRDIDRMTGSLNWKGQKARRR